MGAVAAIAFFWSSVPNPAIRQKHYTCRYGLPCLRGQERGNYAIRERELSAPGAFKAQIFYFLQNGP
jgi:hypothetical protein